MWDISIKTHAHSEVYNNHGMYSKPVYQLNQQQLNIWKLKSGNLVNSSL